MADALTAEHSYADLPAELVRRIFAGAGDHYCAPLSVQDRLRAETTCRAWRQALHGLPFRQLYLRGLVSGCVAEWAKQEWAVLARPAATEVKVWQATELSVRALHSLDRKALEQLWVWIGQHWVSTGSHKFLPRPSNFPNLRGLSVHHMTLDPAWLGQLCQLQRLERLALEDTDMHAPAGQPCQVSGLTALTHLFLGMGDSDDDLPAAQELCLDLATLPSLLFLLELRLALKGAVELRTPATLASGSPGPLPRLQRLCLDGAHSVLVDFAALPALTYLDLDRSSELPGAATIASATSLQCLVLGGMPEYHPADPLLARSWVPEVLRHAPPSLRSLHMWGHWFGAVSKAVAGLAQLRVLSLVDPGFDEHPKDAPSVAQLGPGPVWERLRALQWACGLPLPEAARQATRLELLYYRSLGPLTQPDLDLLSSLPALRQLFIGGQWTLSRMAPGAAVRVNPEALMVANTARRLMPHLETVNLEFLSAKMFDAASAGFALD